MGRHRKIKRGASPSPLFLWEILLGSQMFVIFKPVVNHNDKWKDLHGIIIAALHARALNMTYACVE